MRQERRGVLCPSMTDIAGGVAEPRSEKWYADWQSGEHASVFDSRCRLSNRRLVANYESFNDVRLLNERLDCLRPVHLLEVGCATGEFYRYLRIRFSSVRYDGMDISRPAILRAREKYPKGNFFLTEPGRRIRENLTACGIFPHPEVVYSKDVLHHQTDPFGFLSQLIEVASEALILRTRTRDEGSTVTDPELSCQYHYDGWMPFIVFNLKELTERILAQAPDAELVIYRNHMILGGRENRFVPKEIFLPKTGTAETAIGVFRKTGHPGRIHLEDRKEGDPGRSLWGFLKGYVRRTFSALS